MALDITLITMVAGTRANGCKINSTERVLKSGQMAQNTLVNTKKVKNMEKESSFGLTKAHTKVTSTIIIFMVVASTFGPMEESLMAIGLTIEWKVKVFLPGAMAVNTLASTRTTRNMDTAYSLGQMDDVTTENGSKVSNTAKACI